MDYRIIPGVFLIILGISALFDINIWSYVWPAFLIFIGIKLLSSRNETGQMPNNLGTQETLESDRIDTDVIFSGINKKIISKNFEGGKINAVFGGGEVNLSEAKIKEGKTVTLEVNSIFGGMKIVVPKDWSVNNQIVGVIGGTDNKTAVPAKDEEKGRLVLKGAAVFGGSEIVN